MEESPSAKKARTESDASPAQKFVVTPYYYVVGDIVWVRPAKLPYWPAEVVEVETPTVFKCKLFVPPPNCPETVSAPGSKLFFFDRLRTKEEEATVIESRLQPDAFDTSAYAAQFKAAVEEANDLTRIVLNPDSLAAPTPPDGRVWSSLTLVPVGVVHSHFRTHTDAPRQPHVPGVERRSAVIVVRTGLENALTDLKGFERIWIVFQFSYSSGSHGLPDGEGPPVTNTKNLKTMVVPPRDTQLRGVFATRSPHRPNPIGLSCVRLLDVRRREIVIADHDLLHGTPVLDIKPYLPFCDAHPLAKAGWVDELNARGEGGPDHRRAGDFVVHRKLKKSDP
jgi:tRNA-Thr(GGU) m(6)t(6)A37 methyltransferase TsaA